MHKHNYGVQLRFTCTTSLSGNNLPCGSSDNHVHAPRGRRRKWKIRLVERRNCEPEMHRPVPGRWRPGGVEPAVGRDVRDPDRALNPPDPDHADS